MNMYIPTLRRIYARVHSPLSSPFPSSSVTVLPVCPSMRLSSPLCTRFDVTSLILFHIYIYTRCVYIRALCKHSACNDDVAPRVPASSSNRSTAVRAERWLWFVTLALASPAPRNQRIDRRMKHQRDRRMINSFRPNRTSSGLSDSDTAFRTGESRLGWYFWRDWLCAIGG